MPESKKSSELDRDTSEEPRSELKRAPTGLTWINDGVKVNNNSNGL